MGAEYVLDTQPCLGINERLVVAFVVDAVVADDAHVVGVAEQPVEGGHADRLAGFAAAGTGGEAFAGERFHECPTAPVAGGVLLQCPADEGRAVRVSDDSAYVVQITLSKG